LKTVTTLARKDDFNCDEKFSECWIQNITKLERHENLLNKISFISYWKKTICFLFIGF
jgi:hypothetical protein